MRPSTIPNNKKIARPLIILFWLGVWGGVSLLINREIYLPSPIRTLRAFIELSTTAEFWSSIAMTFIRVAIGFLVSCLAGVILGILCGLNRFLYDAFNPLAITIKSTPVMSVIIIALIWFQSGQVPIFVCFLMCFPVIWTNVVQGVKQVDKRLLQMAKVYKVDRWHILKGIYIPSLTPYLMAGIITSLGFGWKVTVAAEVLSSPKYSIGGHLYNAKVYLESPELFAWTSVVIVLSFAFEYLFKRIAANMTNHSH
ncbi:MAG TPA: ABC transporter permease [Clostridiales bacterium]|jgi:NitT/TauT family transport system permease protein|nr:ABC transporter permease [Clostridiales bacterium]